jgi:hypothetical protein
MRVKILNTIFERITLAPASYLVKDTSEQSGVGFAAGDGTDGRIQDEHVPFAEADEIASHI